MAVITQLTQTALNFILTIRITDILDIAIVAYLVYRLMLLIRRTSSGQVAKGILVLLVLLWTSSFLHLSVINFILGKTVELGLIALIILFQPELRRVLEQMGSSNRLSAVFGGTGAGGDRMEQAIAQTVAAASDFSKNRIGALIVFERDMLLEEVVKTGTVLDAEPSRELFGNIFFPKAPLHDGAAIIREGRIISAGCVLPLSTNVNISRELGTRHRAGLGVSEKSDAVVVIVSEETGSVSAAVEGMLKRHLRPETLDKLLRNELLPADKEEKSPFGLRGFSILKFLRSKRTDMSDEK